jgi:hypothetical protein
MADRHGYTASLRVLSTELPLAELVGILGEPTRGHDIGDPVSSRSATTRKHSLWLLVADVDRSRPLEEHVERLVEFADGHRDHLASVRPRCDVVDVFCGIFAADSQGGWQFSPALMQRLVVLDLPVVFDLYSTAEHDLE